VHGVDYNRQIKPGTLCVLVIEISGGRKTAVDEALFLFIRVVEGELAVAYQAAKLRFDAQAAIYDSEKQKILRDKTKSKQEKQQAIEQLVMPAAPPRPSLRTNDMTVEGVRDALADGHGMIAVISSDAASVLGGYSLGRQESKAASGASLSTFWDGQDTTVMRAGRTIRIKDPRMTMSLAVQPIVAQRFLSDETLRGQGFVNRFLPTWPAPQNGLRTLAQPLSADLTTIAAFNATCAKRLRQALGIGAATEFGSPARPDAVLPLSPAADRVWRRFAIEMERAQGKGGRFEFATGVAARAAEQAARIAVGLQLYQDPGAAVVETAALQAGVALARWYADEWLRVTAVRQAPLLNQVAQRVLDWLQRTYAKGKTFTGECPVVC
jgi:hypothetical protein